MSPFTDFEKWLMGNGFSERDVKEIGFARLYVRDFAHGTDGHNRLLIISRLADVLENRTQHEQGESSD